MKLVVAGLSPRDEAAFGFFLSRTKKSWSWQGVAAGRGASLPQADLLVLDLAALGLAQWSDAGQAELLRLVQGTPAVLLLSAHDRSWSALDTGAAAPPALFWLSKPYGTEDMRLALEKAAAAVVRAAPAAVLPKAAAVSAVPLVSKVAPTPAPVAAPQAAHGTPATELPGLTVADFQNRLALQPDTRPYVFLRKLADMLHQAHPFEARFTVQNSLIVHPLDGWIATNTPMLVIRRVCQSDAMASAVTVRVIDDEQAEERAQRLGMPPQDLDAFLWDLATATLDKKS